MYLNQQSDVTSVSGFFSPCSALAVGDRSRVICRFCSKHRTVPGISTRHRFAAKLSAWLSQLFPRVLTILADGNDAAVDVHPKLDGFRADDPWLADDSRFLSASRLTIGRATQMMPQRRVTCLAPTLPPGRGAPAS